MLETEFLEAVPALNSRPLELGKIRLRQRRTRRRQTVLLHNHQWRDSERLEGERALCRSLQTLSQSATAMRIEHVIYVAHLGLLGSISPLSRDPRLSDESSPAMNLL